MPAKPRIDRVLPEAAPRSAKAHTDPRALDLSRIDPPVWHVMAANGTEGPFTLGQLQAFARSGRIGPLSRISPGDGEPFILAVDHPMLRAGLEAAADARPASECAARNFVVFASAPPEARARLQERLSRHGKLAEALPGLFVLRSMLDLPQLRREIASGSDNLAIVILEARGSRLGSIALTAEQMDAVRRVWNAPLGAPEA